MGRGLRGREAYPCSSRWDPPAPRRRSPGSPPRAPVERLLAAVGAELWGEPAACGTHRDRAERSLKSRERSRVEVLGHTAVFSESKRHGTA